VTLLPYFLVGSVFGFILVEAEVVSWFRIQEMFRFDAFHMYGIIGSAVLTAAISLLTIKRLGLRGADGEPLGFAPKVLGTGVRYLAGGTVFGLGWALTGACPGPLVALVGAGTPVMLVAFASALGGTWTYGRLRPRLPH
jgi:uncharacterized protein